MGLYAIPCRACGKTFMWFSGNLDQRCAECVQDIKDSDAAMAEAKEKGTMAWADLREELRLKCEHNWNGLGPCPVCNLYP